MKILLTSASTGAGHSRAAQAIEAALRVSAPGVECTHVNVMDYVTKPFRLMYEGGYNFVANDHPWMWGVLYNSSNCGWTNRITLPFLNVFQNLNAGHFHRFVQRFAPDKILTTHFLIPQLLSGLLNPTFQKNQVETVITDYGLHNFWVNPTVRHYYVAHEGMRDELTRDGVKKDDVTVSGIPIDPIFLKEVNRDRVRQLLGLRSDIRTVLVLSGGMGFGSMDKTVQALFSLPGPVQLIAVAGKNIELKKKLDSLTPPSSHTLVNQGFVTNMHELLEVSDLVIGKAGGLTVSEGLAKGVPMILFGVLPGQEEKNVSYVCDRGAGVHAETIEEVVQFATDLLQNPSKLESLKSQALKAAHANAAFTVAERLAHWPVRS